MPSFSFFYLKGFHSLAAKVFGNLTSKVVRTTPLVCIAPSFFRVQLLALNMCYYISCCLQVASEHFHFWLTALKLFCEAESLLSVECDTQLALSRQICDAIAKYHKGITTLKVSLLLLCYIMIFSA